MTGSVKCQGSKAYALPEMRFPRLVRLNCFPPYETLRLVGVLFGDPLDGPAFADEGSTSVYSVCASVLLVGAVLPTNHERGSRLWLLTYRRSLSTWCLLVQTRISPHQSPLSVQTYRSCSTIPVSRPVRAFCEISVGAGGMRVLVCNGSAATALYT